MRRFLAALALGLILPWAAAHAQSTPNWATGFVPSAVQWNSLWAAKSDFPLEPGAVNLSSNQVFGSLPLANFPAINAGQIIIGQSGLPPAAETVSGDATLSAAGAVTVTKTNGVAFTFAATTAIGTSGAVFGLLNGNNTYGGNDIFSGTLNFSGLAAGTQVKCLGLDSSNNVVPNSAACGAGGGGTPGGSSNSVQYNNAGAFGGVSLTAGQLLVGQSGAPLAETVSGDATFSALGALTVTKTNGVAFAASATTDTTNAANIISGTLSSSRLPNPSATTIGGVESIAQTAHLWIDSISTLGVPHASQPAFSDISGFLALSQLGASYTNGQLLIGSTSTGQLSAATLTAGSGMSIVNGAASITVASSLVMPASGDIILSNGTFSPAGLAPSTNGDCPVVSAGVWTLGSCGASSGTISSGTAGQIAGYAATGTTVSGFTPGNAISVSTTNHTINLIVPDSTQTANYTIAASDMAGTVNLGGTGAVLTIPAISSTVLAANMSVCYANQGSGNWTISSTPTINGLPSATVYPGGGGCLVSNGTSLDWQPGRVGDEARLNVANTFNQLQTFAGGIGGYTATVGTQPATSCTLTGTGNAGCSSVNTGVGDCGQFIKFTAASSITVTLANSLPQGCQIAFEQEGAGKVTLSAGTGATMHSAHNYVGTAAQYSVIGVTVNGNSGGASAVYIMTGDGA